MRRVEKNSKHVHWIQKIKIPLMVMRWKEEKKHQEWNGKERWKINPYFILSTTTTRGNNSPSPPRLLLYFVAQRTLAKNPPPSHFTQLLLLLPKDVRWWGGGERLSMVWKWLLVVILFCVVLHDIMSMLGLSFSSEASEFQCMRLWVDF